MSNVNLDLGIELDGIIRENMIVDAITEKVRKSFKNLAAARLKPALIQSIRRVVEYELPDGDKPKIILKIYKEIFPNFENIEIEMVKEIISYMYAHNMMKPPSLLRRIFSSLGRAFRLSP